MTEHPQNTMLRVGAAEVNGRRYSVVCYGSTLHSIHRADPGFRGLLWTWDRPLTADVIEIAAAARYP